MNLNEMRAMLKEFKELGLKKERIRSSLETEMKLNPDNSDGYVKLGLYYLSVEDLPESLKNFKKASLLKPGNEHLWFIQGYIFEAAKLYKNAFEAYYYSYRLGSFVAREKLLAFSSSEWIKNIGDKQQEIIKQFKESIC